MNLPLGGLALAAIVLFYKLPFQKTGPKEQLRRIDYLGVFFIMAAIICLLLPLAMGGTTFAWNATAIIVMFCVFAVLVGVLIMVESKATEAIIPPSLFKNRDNVILYSINGLTGLIFMGCTFYIPLYFQIVQKLEDYRIYMWAGLELMTVGVGVLILFDVETSIAQQVVPIFVIGFGNGMIFQNCIIAAQQAAPKEDMAVATALCQLANSIGSAIGVAACVRRRSTTHWSGTWTSCRLRCRGVIDQFDVVNNVNAVPLLQEDVRSLVIQAYADSFQFLFKVLTPIVGLALLMSLFLRKGK
ncbi:hypothetical protein BGZ81_001215 [Podila clonocystis]|nr:hypothetical protein BGZ81_001215 [Podila clonocystis]